METNIGQMKEEYEKKISNQNSTVTILYKLCTELRVKLDQHMIILKIYFSRSENQIFSQGIMHEILKI